MRRNGEGALPEKRGARQVLLAIGIDNLDVLEELFGEDLGDEIMAALWQRLDAALPERAELRATGHRRFLVGLPGIGTMAASALFERLKLAAADTIRTSFGPMAVTISGGCASESGKGGDMPVRAALQALHAAIARGVGSFQLAGDERSLLECRARLRQAASAASGALGPKAAHGGNGAGQLAVAYQPVVHALGCSTISFHECLARVRRPDGTLLPAAAFIPALERLGLAPSIDRQVLATALDMLASRPSARLAVNIFPQTMQDARWMQIFDRAVARDAGLAERLIVEVTETGSVLDPRRTLDFMDRLRRHGVAFALDDFGAGSTSLHHLREFRFDIVKIDARFVRDVRPGSDSAFFIEKLVEIARRFEMMTVAEAVQGPAEARCLTGCGVEYFQGFWFGSPSLMLEPTPSPMPGIAAQA